MRVGRLRHAFVDVIPERLESGTLYISLEHTTMLHLCACGCGKEVVTPLSPTDWRMTFDGEAVSVWPSIGNWSLSCRSHYVIAGGKIRWAEDWTDKQIEQGRAHDRRRKAARDAKVADSSSMGKQEDPSLAVPTAAPPSPSKAPSKRPLLDRLVHRFKG